MEKTKFVYKAFISYTAHDTQFVNKLEEWLILVCSPWESSAGIRILWGDKKFKNL